MEAAGGDAFTSHGCCCSPHSDSQREAEITTNYSSKHADVTMPPRCMKKREHNKQKEKRTITESVRETVGCVMMLMSAPET